MKPILLIGSQGQVGTEIQNILKTTSQLTAISRQQIDLTQPENLRTIIRDIKPAIIINAAAYTAVDKAESEPEIAHTINAITPQIIAQETEKLGSFLIHISTDYVFNGQSNYPYQESDITQPLNIYGTTKLEGEKAIQQTCENHIILRTAWVYGTHGKGNFVKTILKKWLNQELPTSVLLSVQKQVQKSKIKPETVKNLESILPIFYKKNPQV